MSYFYTTQQFLDYLKDITRRLGWAFLKPGEHYMAVEKAQGLGKGGKIKKLGECICISNEQEPLSRIISHPYRFPQPSHMIPRSECEREGFPKLTPQEFVKSFCEMHKSKKCTPDTIINRIEFKRIP